MEKRDQLIQFKVTKTEKETIQNVVEDLKAKGYQPNINASDLVRQSVKRWISIYKKLEDGNALHFIPVSKEIIDNKITMIELEDLSKDEKISPHTRKILHELAESMEFHVYSQLREKYPNYDGFYNMSSVEEDI